MLAIEVLQAKLDSAAICTKSSLTPFFFHASLADKADLEI
jgi:hypothetical protein